MRIHQLTESSNQYLYEGLDRSATQTMMLWESAGFKLKEAALTADQIQQIFQSVEQGATDAGDNRTMLGKGKDATTAIKKAYDDLITKVQTSGPVKGADAMYDSAVAKIEAGLGGPDNAINKVIQKYRKFAKEHPVAQGLIYSILIAAAGISGVGLGGAAVLGLLKMTDKLLQGEKFSTAVGKGLATGATAYAAGQIGQALKGTPTDEVPTGFNARPDDYASAAGDATASVAKGGARAVRDAVAKGALDSAEEYIKAGSITDYNSIGDAVGEIMSNYEGTAKISAQSLQSIEQMVRTKLMASMVDGNGIIQGGKAVAKGVASAAVGDSIIHTGKKLSEGQTYLVFSKVCALNDSMLAEGRLMEGPMDAIKGFAGKAMDKIKTVGTNLTTKVTADKLNSAWQKAGAPTDSDELAQFLEKQGINPAIVKQTFVGMKLPAPGAGAEAAKQKTDFENVKKMIMALPTDRKVRLLKFLTKQSATPQPQV
jgi:hypothetical protein